MLKMKKQRGQGMTEYIVIVALIAVAAIAVYQFFKLPVLLRKSPVNLQVLQFPTPRLLPQAPKPKERQRKA